MVDYNYPFVCPHCGSKWSAAEFLEEHIWYDHQDVTKAEIADWFAKEYNLDPDEVSQEDVDREWEGRG
jgi:hypothetical protein